VTVFSPPLALASLSGAADAEWARAGAPYAGAAFLGGIAVCERSREAAHQMVADRDRSEFLPADPLDWIDEQLTALADAPIAPAVNVRSTRVDRVAEAARVCADHGAALEVNAHCRQAELCAVGCGERLLVETDRLCEFVAASADAGATTSVKVRAEVDGVALAETAARVADAGADWVHVDAMDSESVIRKVADAADVTVVANNGVRDRASTHEYLDHGADAVSVGRPSDDPTVLSRVRRALRSYDGVVTVPE